MFNAIMPYLDSVMEIRLNEYMQGSTVLKIAIVLLRHKTNRELNKQTNKNKKQKQTNKQTRYSPITFSPGVELMYY